MNSFIALRRECRFMWDRHGGLLDAIAEATVIVYKGRLKVPLTENEIFKARQKLNDYKNKYERLLQP